MLRYEIIGNVTLKINLHNGYAVIAIAKWDRNTEKYFVSFYLQDTGHNINHFDLMEDFENIEFESDVKSIKTDIASFIATLLSEKTLDKYISRYKYEQDCFDVGLYRMEVE